jgi:hypothetical protein
VALALACLSRNYSPGSIPDPRSLGVRQVAARRHPDAGQPEQCTCVLSSTMVKLALASPACWTTDANIIRAEADRRAASRMRHQAAGSVAPATSRFADYRPRTVSYCSVTVRS